MTFYEGNKKMQTKMHVLWSTEKKKKKKKSIIIFFLMPYLSI